MSGPTDGRDEETGTMEDTTIPRRPPFDPTAFVLGALFVIVAVVGLLEPDVARRVDIGLLAPTTLVTLGGALLLASALSGRRDGPGARPRR